MVGRTRRNADALAAAFGDGAVVEARSHLDHIAVSGLSKRVDRELRKERNGRQGWRELDENNLTTVVDVHIAARIVLLSHPNGRVRMAAVQSCAADPAAPTGTLRTLVHRCTDRVSNISTMAREVVSTALAEELERSDGGELTTSVAYAVAELRRSADLVLQCPTLVIDALELTSTSRRPPRRLTLRTTHQYDQLAGYLGTMDVPDETSELARQQLSSWLREQISLYGRFVIDETS